MDTILLATINRTLHARRTAAYGSATGVNAGEVRYKNKCLFARGIHQGKRIEKFSILFFLKKNKQEKIHIPTIGKLNEALAGVCIFYRKGQCSWNGGSGV